MNNYFTQTFLKSLKITLLAFLVFLGTSTARAADYYWVGGTGVWTDLNHWATSSGGSTHPAIVPTPIDNVIIDVNSFTLTGGTITINFEAFCNSLLVTGTRSPNINFAFAAGFNSTAGILVAAGPTLNWVQASRLISGQAIELNNVNLSNTVAGLNIQVKTGNLKLFNNSKFTGNSATVSIDAGTLEMTSGAQYIHNSGTITSGNGVLNVVSGAIFQAMGTTQNIKNGSFVGSPGSTIVTNGTWNLTDAGYEVSRLSNYTKHGGGMYFNATKFGQYNIAGGGKDMHRIELNGTNYNAEYRLTDSLALFNDGLYLYANKFISNAQKVNVFRFYAWTTNPLTIDFTGTDTVMVNYEFRIYPTASISFNPGNATISAKNNNNHIYFYGGNKDFNDIVLNAQGANATGVFIDYINTCRDMKINLSGYQYMDYSNASGLPNRHRNFNITYTNNSLGIQAPKLRFLQKKVFTNDFTIQSVSNIRPIVEFNFADSFNRLDLNGAGEVIFTGVQNVNNFVPLVGSCQRTFLIHSSAGGSLAYIKQATGTVSLDWAQLQDIGGMGGATFVATNTTNLGNNPGWTISGIPSQTFYWIGGSGNWTDPLHWSLSSGGTAGCAIPSRIDNVIFDANSFTVANQYCTINGTAECKNMTWQGTITGAGMNGSQPLNIFGSYQLSPTMFYNYSGILSFMSITPGNTISFANKISNNQVVFAGQNQNTGVWTLLDSLNCNSTLSVNYGKLITGGNNIYAAAIQINSTVDFTGTPVIRVAYNWTANPASTLIMGNANIYMEYMYNISFNSYANNWATAKRYNTVTINHTGVSTYSCNMNGYYNVIKGLNYISSNSGYYYDQMYYDSIGTFNLNFTNPTNHPYPRAQLYGYIYTYYYGYASSRVIDVLNINGNAQNKAYVELSYYSNLKIRKLNSNGAERVLFYPGLTKAIDSIYFNGTCNAKTFVGSMNSGSAVSITCNNIASANTVVISDITLLGSGSYSATNSANLGNVTNWNFVSTGTNYYWVGGNGNWSDGTKWALSSGGVGSGCIPGPADNVFFDVNSFTGANQTVTLNQAGYCNSMLWNNVNSPRFAGSYQLNVYGSMLLDPNLNWNMTGAVYFQSRKTGNTINTNGKSLYNVFFNGDGSYQGEWTLQNELSSLTDIYFRSGKFISGGYRVRARSIYNDYNDSRITLDFTGTDTIYSNYDLRFYYAPTVLMSGTNIKFTNSYTNVNRFYGGNKVYKDVVFVPSSNSASTYTIEDNNTFRNIQISTAAYPTFNFTGSNTFNDVNFTFSNATTNIPQITFSGTNTFNNLTVTSTGNGGPYLYLNQNNTFNSLVAAGLGTRLLLGASRTQTVNSLLALGNGSFPVIVKSQTTGTQATIYKPSGRVCLDFVLLQDVRANALSNGAGGLQTQFFAGASSVNLGNNTNWSFSSCNAFYWVGDNGNWSDYANHWATSSGGTTFQTTVPGPNDDVFFDANSFTTAGRTVNVDVPVANMRDLKWGSAVFNPTFTGSGEMRIYGDLELISGMTQNYTGDWKFMATDNNHFVNTGNKNLENVYFIGGNSGIGEWKLLNPLNVNNSIYFNNGTLTTNNNAINTRNFYSNTANTRIFNLGSSIVRVTNGTWDVSTLSNTALVEGTSSIIMNGTGTGSIFNGSNLTYSNVTFTTTGALESSLNGNNTFTTLRVDKGLTLNVNPGTQTFTNFIADGSCASPIIIRSSVIGVQAIFSKTSGIVNTTFLQLKDMKAQGGATFNANYSTNAGNTTGWNFTAPPTLTTAITTTNSTCAAGNDGAAAVTTVTGGVAPFTYLWSTTETTSSISNLIPGNYSVTVKDAAGCSVTTPVTIITTPGVITPTPFTASSLDVCIGTTINFTAGTPPEAVSSYRWNFGDFTTSTAQNPSKTYANSGTYNVSLSYIDANGCPTVVTATVRVSIVNALVTKTNINCFGSNDGTINIATSTGFGPFQYSINNGSTYGTAATYTNMTPGTYQIRVKDALGCLSTQYTVAISQPAAALSASASKVNVSCAAATNGSITITASGGTAPYNYSINGGILYLTTNTFSNLSSGTYNVVVRDANNCLTASQAITIVVADVTAPSIFCPTNVSANLISGCSAFVTVPAISAGDNCGISSIVNSFTGTEDASGNYPVGVTNVTWTVTDVNNNVSTCVMSVTVNGPEIAVSGNNASITDGSTSASSTNYTDFGGIVPSNTVSKTYTIENLGTLALNISNISISGTDAANFTVSGVSLPASIVAGANTTFTVTFSASTPGFKNATVQISSNDCDESPYDFAVKGEITCTMPLFTTCVTNINSNAPTSNCNAMVSYSPVVSGIPTPSITYQFSGATTASGNGNGSGSIFNKGITTVTLTASNSCGTTTCTFTVTVNDVTAPIVVTKSASVYLDATGNGSLAAADVNNGSTDNCGIASLSIDKTNFNCSHVGGGNNKSITMNNSSSVVIADNPALRIPGDITVEAWVRVTSLNGDWVRVVGKGDATYRNYGLWYHPQGYFLFQQYGGGTEVIFARPVVVGEWIHFAGVREGGVGKLYINGVLQNTRPASGAPYMSSHNLTIGYAGYHTMHNGQIDEVRIWNYARSAAQMLDKYNKTLSGSEAGLVAYYNMESGAGSSLPDATNHGYNGTVVNSTFGTLVPFGTGSGNTVNLTVTDVNGNSSQGVAAVSVYDTIVPIVNTQNVTIQLNASGIATLTAAQINNNSTDNCGIATYAISNSNFTCANLGSNTVTLTVTDVNGNSKTGTSVVTVEDMILPNIICPANINVFATNASGATVNYTTPTATDNCSATVSRIAGLASGSVFPIGSTTITYRATDASGNIKDCSFTVNVTGLAPVVNCPANISVNATNGVCGATVTYAATETTGIPASVITYSHASGYVFPVGTTTVTVTASNAVGTSTCTFNVVVTDNQAPSISCPAQITVNNDINKCGAMVSVTAATATDNCSISSIVGVRNDGLLLTDEFPVGNTTITWTATDIYGLSSSCNQVVKVNDVQVANVVTKNIDLYLNATGTATIAAADVNNGSTDNCGIASYSVSPNSFTCGNVGNNQVTLTITDIHGNVSSAQATVQVLDTIRPQVGTNNITVYLDQNGNAAVSAAALNNGSSDACGISSVSVSDPILTCANVGANTVTLTVTDVNGNISSSNATITVLDTVKPIAIAQNVIVNLDINGNGSISTSDVNNGSSDACGTASLALSKSTFDCSNVGNNTITLTVTDVNGNVSTTSSDVLVVDHIAPIVNTQDVTVYLNASGEASITASMVNNGSTDACGIASMSVSPNTFNCGKTGMPNEVTLTVTDVNGNVATKTANVTVIDQIAPTVNTQDITIQLNANGTASITAADVNNNSTDNCAIDILSVSPANFTCANVGDNEVTLTVTDVHGNTATATANVKVKDEVAPVVNAQNITIYLNASGSASTTAAAVNNGSTDACGIANMSLSKTNFDCSNVGANTVTLTVTDVNGNSASANATVTVLDQIAPIATAQDITVQLDANGSVSITADDINYGSSDACGIANLSLSKTTFNCSNVGANTVTLTVTDVNGNSATANSTVTVQDQIAPSVVTKNITIQLNAYGNATITPSDINNGSTDNCSISDLMLSKTSFDCSNVGNNTVTLTVTDVNGNSANANATVTVKDEVAPIAIAQNVSITLSGGTASVTAAAVNNGSSDACGIASMTLSKTNFNCSNIGSNTVTLTVTDVNGNSSSTSAIVNVIGAIPTVAISQGVQPGFTQGGAIVLTASSPTATSYVWSGGPSTAAYYVYATGTYSVTATNSYGCTVVGSYMVNYNAANLLSSYIIIGKEEVKLEDHVAVQNGGVGATKCDGEVEIEDYSTVTAAGTFVRAVDIEVESNSAATTKIFSAVPTSILPTFLYNPYCTSSSCSNGHHGSHGNGNCSHSHHSGCSHNSNNCSHSHHATSCSATCTNSHHATCNNRNNNSNNNKNIAQGATVTITDSIMGQVVIGKDAIVTFTSPRLYMKGLEIKEGARVNFVQCATIRVCNHVKMMKNSRFNTSTPTIVTLYIEKKLEVEDGSWVTANVYALEEIKIKGKNTAPTLMKGLYIAEEVEAEKYVNFTWNTNTTCTNGNYKSEFLADEQGLIKDYFEADLYPNPSNGVFNVRLLSSSTEAYQIDVYDMNGRMVDTKKFNDGGMIQEMEANYSDGMYLVRITQGENSKTIRMVRTR